MVVSGIVTFLLSVYILMDLGSRYHGSYEHYGREYGVLTWIPVIIGFLAPAVFAGFIRLVRQSRTSDAFRKLRKYD